MKRFLILFIITFGLTGCASLSIADEKVIEPKVEKPADVTQGAVLESPETPSFAHINQAKMDLLSWQIRYWKENKRAIELEYTGLIFKDVRHQMAITEIDRITKQIQHLLIH